MPLELDGEQREIVWTVDRRRVWAHGVKACACSQQPDLVSIGSIEINLSCVGMSAAFGTVASSKLSSLKMHKLIGKITIQAFRAERECSKSRGEIVGQKKCTYKRDWRCAGIASCMEKGRRRPLCVSP